MSTRSESMPLFFLWNRYFSLKNKCMEESWNQKKCVWLHWDHWHEKKITKKSNNDRIIVKSHPCGSPHHVLEPVVIYWCFALSKCFWQDTLLYSKSHMTANSQPVYFLTTEGLLSGLNHGCRRLSEYLEWVVSISTIHCL